MLQQATVWVIPIRLRSMRSGGGFGQGFQIGRNGARVPGVEAEIRHRRTRLSTVGRQTRFQKMHSLIEAPTLRQARNRRRLIHPTRDRMQGLHVYRRTLQGMILHQLPMGAARVTRYMPWASNRACSLLVCVCIGVGVAAKAVLDTKPIAAKANVVKPKVLMDPAERNMRLKYYARPVSPASHSMVLSSTSPPDGKAGCQHEKHAT